MSAQRKEADYCVCGHPEGWHFLSREGGPGWSECESPITGERFCRPHRTNAALADIERKREGGVSQ